MHYQGQYLWPILCQIFIHVLTLAKRHEDWSTILWHSFKVTNFTPISFELLVFHNTAKIIWNIFCFNSLLSWFNICIAFIPLQGITSRWTFEQNCQESLHSSIAMRLNICEEHFGNHILYSHCHICAAFTHPRLRYCNVGIQSEQHSHSSFKPLYPLSSTHTSMHSCSCTHVAAPGRCGMKKDEESTRQRHCEDPHWDSRQLQ